MRQALACLAFVAMAIAGVWVWLGSPVLMPYPQVGRAEKLYCVSYAPFRGLQTPLDPATMIPAAQIDDDLARLSEITDCVRTYSVDFGLDQIAGIAAKHDAGKQRQRHGEDLPDAEAGEFRHVFLRRRVAGQAEMHTVGDEDYGTQETCPGYDQAGEQCPQRGPGRARRVGRRPPEQSDVCRCGLAHG